MSAQLLNMGLVFVIMQAANKLEIDREENIVYIRIAYLSAQVLQLLVLGWILNRIKYNKDETVLTYTEPKNPLDPNQQEPKVVKTTVQEYDTKNLMTQAQQLVIGLLMIGFIHFKWGYIRPLTLQIILGPKTLWSTPLFQIYILGKQTVGELARPFKPKSIFPTEEPPTVKEVKAKEKKDAKKKLNRYD